MKFLSKEDLNLLGSLPLTDVMRNNNHRIVRRTKRSAFYHCPLPGHKDADASFSVELAPSADDNGDMPNFCAFNCMGCHNISGRGAIELQAALMGLTTTGKDFVKVATRLVRDFNLHIDGIQPAGTQFSFVDYVDEFQYVECEWTDEHLRALGCDVRQKFGTGRNADEEATEENIYSWAMVGEIGYEEQKPVPFNPNELGRIFGLYPISEFTTPGTEQVDGTVRSYRQQMQPGYPVFIFKSTDAYGNWRIKKYEPYNRPDTKGRQYKWTWWYQGGKNLDGDFANALYGDCDVMDALYNKDIVPTDSSTYKNHPVVTQQFTDKNGVVRERKLFKRVIICSGPRDALQVYYHSDAHVVYPHSEHAKISIKAIHRLLAISEQVYILYDMDETGKRAAKELNLEYLQMATINLPEDLSTIIGRRTGKPCKDVSDFFEQYREIARYKSSLRNKTLNEMFHDMIQNARKLRFWKRHSKKNAVVYDDGSAQEYVYEIDADNVLGFLAANGMGIYKGNTGRMAARFVHVTDNIVEFINDGDIVKECKQIMKEWLANHSAYNNSDLRSLITKSTQIISKNLLEELPIIDINPIVWESRSDYLFFLNGALHITPTKRTLIPYAELDFYVNKELVLPRNFVPTEDCFEISVHPMLEQYEREHNDRLIAIEDGDVRAFNDENEKWKEIYETWSYKLTLLKPMNDCPVALQFIYDTCRIFWQKEQAAKRAGKPREQWLSAEEKQIQDMIFISKVAAFGYMLTRYRQPNMGRIVYLIDYSVESEHKNYGGTGKSLMAKMPQCVRHMYHIDGKAWKTSAEMIGRNFVSYDPLKHGYIHIEDLARGVSCETLYNVANSALTKKQLNKDEESIPEELVAKAIVTANNMFDLSDPSNERRLWVLPTSNYYHTRKYGMSPHDPFMKFGMNIGCNDMPYDEWNAMVNLFVSCMQFYMRVQTHIPAPQGADGVMRELRNMKEFKKHPQFVDWANKFFEGDLFFGVPMPKRDMIVSYYQFAGMDVTYNGVDSFAKSKDFGEMLKAYCYKMKITINPDISYKKKSEIGRLARAKAFVYDWGTDGRLNGKRRMEERASCYWFYRRGEEPLESKDVMFDQRTDPGCEGYVISEE